jgi:hypothetical protein
MILQDLIPVLKINRLLSPPSFTYQIHFEGISLS